MTFLSFFWNYVILFSDITNGPFFFLLYLECYYGEM